MKRLLLDYTPFCTRGAIVNDGELVDFSIERADVRSVVGNIFKGKVENVIGGMQAAFVNIGEERNGFLYVGDSRVDERGLVGNLATSKRLNVSAGDVIMCQAVKDAYAQKGARVSMDITVPGNYIVLMPLGDFVGVSRKIEDAKRRKYLEDYIRTICPEGMGYIVRTGAEKASDEAIACEMQELLVRWEEIKKAYAKASVASTVHEEANLLERALRETQYADVDEVIVNDESVQKMLQGQFDKEVKLYTGERNIMSHYGVSCQINGICDHKVVLENGAYIVIDKTEALTVIDVNTGKFVGTSHLEDTVFKTNLAAARGIAKVLRLRNISGIVLIDFIDMVEQEHKDKVIEELKEALKTDRLKTSAVSMTPLGLVELTRKKTRLPLDDFMLQPCKDCAGGYVRSDAQLAFELRDDLVDFVIEHRCQSVYVGAHPSIVNMVLESNILKRKLENGWKNKRIFFYEDETLKREKWNISSKMIEGKAGYLRVLA